MPFLASLRRGLPLAGQCALILFGLAILYALPPARGRMLLVPLTAAARAALAPAAVDNGARLVSAGPWVGSLLVDGRWDRLAGPLLTRGVIVLAARAGGCEAGA